MRKAGQVGVWLVLIAVSWTSAGTRAQEASPSVPASRVESDPRLSAADEAWREAWRGNVEVHLRSVAARGTPRDLLAAGWLWPMETDEASIAERGVFSRPQAREWIQTAYDRARGDDVLVDWALLDACAMTDAACDRGRLLQRLMAADPGNAEILLTAYQDAIERKDSAAAESYWQAAARGTHYRPRINELGALMASVLRQAQAPVLGEDLGLGRSATASDMADVVVMALNVAIVIPTLQPIQQRCSARVGHLPADTRAACRRIYALLSADESTLLPALVSLPRLVEWADTEVERTEARGRLRRFAWLYENSLRQYGRPGKERRLPVDHLNRLFREGELAAMRYQLAREGIAAEPPAGWRPDNPEWRALLGDSPAAR